ncbi:MAG: DUF2201 family putative metallopeptidase [Candidatus Acidifodinimicrobium sp.]
MISNDRFLQYHEAIAMLMLKAPSYAMFGDFLGGIKLEEMDHGVAATDGSKFYIGPLFKNYTTEERAFIIAHELNHILLRHPWRSVGMDNNLYNVAGDYVINDALHLLDMPNIPLPGTPITLDQLLNSDKAKQESKDMKGILYDESLRNMDTDSIYRLLMNKRAQMMKNAQGMNGTGEMKEEEADRKMIGESPEGDMNGGDVIENHDKESEKEIIKKMQDSIKKYRETHEAGTGTDADKRILDLLDITTALPWTAILQRYLKNLIASNYTWSPPKALYYPEEATGNVPNTYLPRLREKTVRIAIAIDTSGSIGEADMAVFMSNIQALFNAILQQVGYVGLFMLTTDEVYWYKKMPPVPYATEVVDNVRSGGTDFRPAFKLIDQMMIAPPDVFIYFTDGYGDYPEIPPKYDVLWLLTPGSDATPPFGQVIHFSL